MPWLVSTDRIKCFDCRRPLEGHFIVRRPCGSNVSMRRPNKKLFMIIDSVRGTLRSCTNIIPTPWVFLAVRSTCNLPHVYAITRLITMLKHFLWIDQVHLRLASSCLHHLDFGWSLEVKFNGCSSKVCVISVFYVHPFYGINMC